MPDGWVGGSGCQEESRWVRGERVDAQNLFSSRVYQTCSPNMFTKHVHISCWNIICWNIDKVTPNICFHDAGPGHLVTQAFLQMTFLPWILTERASLAKVRSSQDISISQRKEHDGLSRPGILRRCRFGENCPVCSKSHGSVGESASSLARTVCQRWQEGKKVAQLNKRQ